MKISSFIIPRILYVEDGVIISPWQTRKLTLTCTASNGSLEDLIIEMIKGSKTNRSHKYYDFSFIF